MKKEEEIRKLAEDYIDSCTKKSGFVILAESLKGDFIDLFVAGFMKCLEINKANEWHYVKDGDYPKEKGNYLVAWKRTHHVEEYGEWGFDVDLFNADEGYFEGVGDYVIAWKEIVLPELKESV